MLPSVLRYPVTGSMGRLLMVLKHIMDSGAVSRSLHIYTNMIYNVATKYAHMGHSFTSVAFLSLFLDENRNSTVCTYAHICKSLRVCMVMHTSSLECKYACVRLLSNRKTSSRMIESHCSRCLTPRARARTRLCTKPQHSFQKSDLGFVKLAKCAEMHSEGVLKAFVCLFVCFLIAVTGHSMLFLAALYADDNQVCDWLLFFHERHHMAHNKRL